MAEQELPEAVKAHLDGIKSNLNKILTELEPRIKSLESSGQGAAELKDQVAKLSAENAERIEAAKASMQKDYTDRMDEIETKMKERQRGGDASRKSAGSIFVESDAYKAAPNVKSTRPVTVPHPAVKEVDYSEAPSLTPPTVLNEMVRPQNMVLALRSLIPGGQSDSDVIKYPKLIERAANASRVEEGASKPQSNLTFEDATAVMDKIAHYIPVTEEQLSNWRQLRSVIDAELRDGILREEDRALLHGGGSGWNIEGIIPQATAYDAANFGDMVDLTTHVDHLRGMIAQLQVANYAPDGFVLNPWDWFLIETTKTTGGAYIFANPQGVAGSRMWGLPVVQTTQMTQGEALVGAFRIGAQIFDGQFQGVYGVQLKTGQPNDYFLRNMYAILAEERLALAVKRPDAFVTGSIGPSGGATT